MDLKTSQVQPWLVQDKKAALYLFAERVGATAMLAYKHGKQYKLRLREIMLEEASDLLLLPPETQSTKRGQALSYG